MKKANRRNRKKYSYSVQGYKDYKTGETHKPLNNHEPRVGTKSRAGSGKCKCSICTRTTKELKEKILKEEFEKSKKGLD